MALKVTFSSQSLIEIESTLQNLAEFDIGAAFEFERLLSAKALAIAENPQLYPIALVSRGRKLRYFLVKSRIVVYQVSETDGIHIARVFGPGQNWQKTL